MSDEPRTNDQLAIGLEAVAGQIHRWLDWHKEHRDKEHLTTDGGTSIMSLPVPFWPNHAQFEAWIKLFDEARAVLRTSALPDKITPAIVEALGMPNFQCGPLAHYFRMAGHPIKERSEDEQAFVLFWALKLAIQHGIAWRTVGGNELDALRKTLEAKSP